MKMYKLISRAVIVASLCSSVALSGNTPPPAPPDPERLSAATAMVALMPIETSLGSYNSMFSIRRDVVKGAFAWMERQPDLNRDETLDRLFRAKIEIEIRNEFSAAASEAAPMLAEYYARRLTKHEIEATIAFIRTPPGLKYVTVQLQNDDLALRLVNDRIYRRIFPKFPQILLSAMESRAILERLR